MKNLDPMFEEALAACCVMVVFCALIALAYWAVTGLSPWPYVVIAELTAASTGVALLTLTSPRRKRN